MACIARADVCRDHQRLVRDERARERCRRDGFSRQTRRMARAVQADVAGAVRQAAVRRAPAGPASGLRCLAHDAARAQFVRPGKAGGADRGYANPLPDHQTRGGCARPARRVCCCANRARATSTIRCRQATSSMRSGSRRAVSIRTREYGVRFMERVLADLTPGMSKIYMRGNRFLADRGVLPEIKARVARAQRPAPARRCRAAADVSSALQGGGRVRRRRVAGAEHPGAGGIRAGYRPSDGTAAAVGDAAAAGIALFRRPGAVRQSTASGASAGAAIGAPYAPATQGGVGYVQVSAAPAAPGVGYVQVSGAPAATGVAAPGQVPGVVLVPGAPMSGGPPSGATGTAMPFTLPPGAWTVTANPYVGGCRDDAATPRRRRDDQRDGPSAARPDDGAGVALGGDRRARSLAACSIPAPILVVAWRRRRPRRYAPAPPLNRIPFMRSAIADKVGSSTDKITMDVIGLLFDYIFRDPSIPSSLRSVFTPPAGADPEDGTDRSQLLLRPQASGTAPARSPRGRGDRRHRRRRLRARRSSSIATGVVDEVCREFKVDVATFEGADAKLQEFIDARAAQGGARDSTAEVAQALAAEENEADRSQVRALIRDKLAGSTCRSRCARSASRSGPTI